MAVKMIVPAGISGSVYGRSGLTYTVASDGTISNVNYADVGPLLEAGFLFAISRHNQWNVPTPVAASAAVTVASTSLSAGNTLTIAAQPDVPRQLQAVINSGSATLSAGGNLQMVYTANDGTTQTDNLAFGGIAATSTQTLTTTKGVEHLTSAEVTVAPSGAAANAGVQIGTNGVLALPVDPGFVDFTVTKETKVTPTNGTLGLSVPADETVGTVTASGALIAPTQAPDGTHSFSFGYSYTFPA